MTVGELIKKLKKYPSNTPVMGRGVGFGGMDTQYDFRPEFIREGMKGKKRSLRLGNT